MIALDFNNALGSVDVLAAALVARMRTEIALNSMAKRNVPGDRGRLVVIELEELGTYIGSRKYTS